MAYSNKVLDHYENPRNVGTMDKDDEDVGTGLVGAPACGDVMKLQIKIKDNKIMLTDSVGVTLKVPNFNEIQATIGDISEIGSNDIFSVLAQSIESIFDAEEVHSKGDFTTKELNDFVNELSTEQFNNIMQWFSSLPKLIKDVEYNCSKCGTPCKVRLEGIQNFFV